MIFAQRLSFFAPFGEPDVLVGHLTAGPRLERLLARVDQLADEVELLLVLGEVGAVGCELVAGQAGVPALAHLPRWEQAPAVGATTTIGGSLHARFSLAFVYTQAYVACLRR
jgi:hypothetical protein